ncbi:hypothetical protein AMJ40_01575 [candidate division TA06 bacterium DG_26]|uniref:LPS-assembly protein LptD central domain-containing protein n=1 Tax=candidate division TA06 bacterium DG_26 TaxID=1703771 RepID=A0A0S7WL54_UNCT6|nr:MAG: hypothetical protein AMJ40_01575 [candidate division TA06 bacterium DG_26]
MKFLPLLILISQLHTPAPRPVRYYADRITFFIQEEKVILKGETRITHGDLSVEADSVEYELKTEQLRAYGKPILRDGDETIEGDYMEYDVGIGRGTILNAKTEIRGGHFRGAKVKRVGEDVLNVSTGRFTTCDLDEPHYYFKARRMRMYVDDMVLCQPVILYIQEIPVLAVPFWIFPIRKERHSGFLTPRVGRDSEEGRFVKNLSYYQVINDYADGTLTVDYMERVGFRVMLEGIYLVKPWVSGGAVGSFVEDRRFNKSRWNLDFSHRQYWGDGYSLLARGNFISDRTYYREYSEDLSERMTRTVDSYVAFSKSYRSFAFSLVTNETRNLELNTQTGVLPQVTFSLLPVELGNSIYISHSAVLVNRYASGVSPTQNVRNTLKLNMKQRLGWLNVTPSVQHVETWVRDQHRAGTTSLEIGASTNIYGTSTRKIGWLEGVRHVITPSVNYALGLKREDTTERLGFAIRNSVQLNLASLGKVDLFTTTTSGSYDMRRTKWTPLVTRIEMSPVPRLALSCDFGYNVEEGKVDYVNQTSQTSYRKENGESLPFSLALTQSYHHRRGRDPEFQVWGDFTFNLTKNWYVSYRGRYDVIGKKPVSHSLRVIRDLHCWEAELNVESTRVHWRYDFKISIKAIPEINLKKGFFSLFLP